MSQPRGTEGGWDPFGELQALRAELARLIGGRGGSPDVELSQGDAGWTVTARLPGVAPEEVALELDDRELCIRARSEAEVNADQGMAGTGSRVRGFEYRVTLPAAADPAGVDAVMDHGLLTVTVPRAVRAQRRTITVGRRQYPSGRRDTGAGGVPGPPGPIPGSAADRTRPVGVVDPAADRELHRPDVAAGDGAVPPGGRSAAAPQTGRAATAPQAGRTVTAPHRTGGPTGTGHPAG
jgi:HSP20 family protein